MDEDIYRFHLPIETEETLKLFVKTAWGVEIPDVKVCENHTTPFRAFADAYFAKSPVTVWHGSRGFAGKSFTLAVLAMTEAATLGANVNLLGGSGAQSKIVLRHQSDLWHYKNAPRQLLRGDAATITRLTNGAEIEALMASQTSVRGPHPQRLRLDEIDEMDMALLEAAQGQPMSTDGIPSQTVMSSNSSIFRWHNDEDVTTCWRAWVSCIFVVFPRNNGTAWLVDSITGRPEAR